MKAEKKKAVRKAVEKMNNGEIAADNRLEVLDALIAVLEERRDADPGKSYTARLLAGGRHKAAKKLGEEGVELALAVVDGKKREVRAEAADVLYHFLVCLMARKIGFAEVMEELEGRFGLSGLEEKASRKEG